MPETCSRSPQKYATYGVSNEIVVCTGGSSRRFCTCVASQPTARMPETCSRSPQKYATYGVSNEIVVCTGGSSRRFCTCVASQPTARPTQMPPVATKRNCRLACPSENAPVITAATANRNEMNDVASFTKLSPSRITIIFRGTRKCCVTDSAATASGGEIIAPNTKPTASGNPTSQ